MNYQALFGILKGAEEMKVKAKFLGMPKSLPIFENGKEFQVDFIGDTLEDFLNCIVSKTGYGKKNIFFDDQGEISLEISAFINGRHLGLSNRLRQRLHEDDLIEIWYEHF